MFSHKPRQLDIRIDMTDQQIAGHLANVLQKRKVRIAVQPRQFQIAIDVRTIGESILQIAQMVLSIRWHRQTAIRSDANCERKDGKQKSVGPSTLKDILYSLNMYSIFIFNTQKGQQRIKYPFRKRDRQTKHKYFMLVMDEHLTWDRTKKAKYDGARSICERIACSYARGRVQRKRHTKNALCGTHLTRMLFASRSP